MSLYSENIANQVADLRERFGTSVVFQDQTYIVQVEKAASVEVGTMNVTGLGLGAFAADLDPHVFDFDPALFTPVTDQIPPQKQDTLLWQDLPYLITHVTYDDVEDDTIHILVYAYKIPTSLFSSSSL